MWIREGDSEFYILFIILFYLFIFMFTFLATLGLSCITQNLLFVAWKLLVVSYGI